MSPHSLYIQRLGPPPSLASQPPSFLHTLQHPGASLLAEESRPAVPTQPETWASLPTSRASVPLTCEMGLEGGWRAKMGGAAGV